MKLSFLLWLLTYLVALALSSNATCLALALKMLASNPSLDYDDCDDNYNHIDGGLLLLDSNRI